MLVLPDRRVGLDALQRPAARRERLVAVRRRARHQDGVRSNLELPDGVQQRDPFDVRMRRRDVRGDVGEDLLGHRRIRRVVEAHDRAGTFRVVADRAEELHDRADAWAGDGRDRRLDGQRRGEQASDDPNTRLLTHLDPACRTCTAGDRWQQCHLAVRTDARVVAGDFEIDGDLHACEHRRERGVCGRDRVAHLAGRGAVGDVDPDRRGTGQRRQAAEQAHLDVHVALPA